MRGLYDRGRSRADDVHRALRFWSSGAITDGGEVRLGVNEGLRRSWHAPKSTDWSGRADTPAEGGRDVSAAGAAEGSGE